MGTIRRRIYNPAHLTRDELKASFVAREDTLAELLRVIREQTPGRPCQHMMLIGARGMGKTTLGLRFLYAIEEDPDLHERWQPVAFHEESYGIGSLADFWIHALRHLTRATGESRWEQRAEALVANEADQERAAAYALAELTDFNRESERRLIMFVENFDSIVAQIHDERQIHSLRATLIERPEILLLGSANAYFESIGGYGEPLYEFFRVVKLEGIGEEEARRILEAAASAEGRPEVSESLNVEQGRLETIRRLTGGNPRLLALGCRLLIESPLGSAVEDLERLIDEQTPYFKARIEDLPGQARKVFHCLSEGWKPLLAKEVAAAANLSSSHASAQLKQLVEKGYVREVQLSGSTRTRYDVRDRFYSIYYLLRFSSSERARLERLVAFFHDLDGPSADSILGQDDDWRISEAVECARHATKLPSDDPSVLLTLARVLARRGNWTEAMNELERSVRMGSRDFQQHERHALTEVIIRCAAAGHGPRAIRILAEGDLVELMEPLWHAVRAEMGEELEPLPSEIMDAMWVVRQRIRTVDGGSHAGKGQSQRAAFSSPAAASSPQTE